MVSQLMLVRTNDVEILADNGPQFSYRIDKVFVMISLNLSQDAYNDHLLEKVVYYLRYLEHNNTNSLMS
jgi:hypothetical protein